MRLKKITIGQLDEFIHSNEYLSYGTAPITPERAFCQIRNPQALPSDVALTLALSEENQLIGFIGALPTRILDVRCAWNSCWWVKEGTPAEISLKLFFSFLTDWDKKVLFSELTPHTVLLIEKMKFCNQKTIQGLRGYYRFNLADILPRKKAYFKKATKVIRLFDVFANHAINLFSSNKITASKTTNEVIDFPSEVLNHFISTHNTLQPNKRYSIDFKWIKEYGWLTEKHQGNGELNEKYPFSYRVGRFESNWVKFSVGNQLVGLVCYTIRDKELKLPYVFVNEDQIPNVGNYFFHQLKTNKKLCSITTFHPALANYLANNKQFLFKTHLPKFTAVSKNLCEAASILDFELQMGDGDCIFT